MANYKEELKETAQKAVSKAEEMLSPENLNQVSNLVGKSIGNFVHEKQDKLINIKDQYEGTIKDNPLASVATAFAVGVIMGLLVRRN